MNRFSDKNNRRRNHKMPAIMTTTMSSTTTTSNPMMTNLKVTSSGGGHVVVTPTTVAFTSDDSSTSNCSSNTDEPPMQYQHRRLKNQEQLSPDTVMEPLGRSTTPISLLAIDESVCLLSKASSSVDDDFKISTSQHNNNLNRSVNSQAISPQQSHLHNKKQQRQHFDNAGVDNTGNSSSSSWAIPKWTDLESKRLALCQKRVQLERRLFEFHLKGGEGTSTMTTPPPQQSQQHLVGTTTGRNRRQKGLSTSSVVSQTSATSSKTTTTALGVHSVITTPIRNHNVTDNDVDVSDHDTVILHRYVLRSDQDPVLWSGPVNGRNVPEGFGRMVFSDGQIYEGDVINGQRNGKGVNVWPNGQIFTGSWIKNSRSGRGTHRWPDGRSVTGPWLNGHLQGRVFFSWPDGATYDGDTVKGQKEGRGIHTWKDGRVYSGQYRNGAENGFGTLTERGQYTKYRGQFKNGKRNGYGIQIWKNKTYDGEWYENMIHGRGKLSWLSGACYTGSFQYGRYCGNGCYRGENGTKYVGQWIDGYKQGQGRQYWADGRVYHGSFERGQRHGYGRLTYADGTVYTGGWENGRRAGHGIEVCSIVDEVSGELVNRDITHCGMWCDDQAVVTVIPIPDDDAENYDDNKLVTADDTGVRPRRKYSVKFNTSVTSILDRSVDDLYLLKPRTVMLDDEDYVARRCGIVGGSNTEKAATNNKNPVIVVIDDGYSFGGSDVSSTGSCSVQGL